MLVVGVNAGLRGVFGLSGRGSRRVAAFRLSGLLELAVFFITISHCPWRDFISFSTGEKETEAKKTPLNNRQVSVPSVQASVFGT